MTPTTTGKKGTLFIAPIGTRKKKEPLFEELFSHCPENNYSSVLYIGPNNFVLSSARKQFHSFLKKTVHSPAYIPFQSATIKQLASDLHEKYGQKKVITDRTRTLIFCEMLGNNTIGYGHIVSDLLKKTRHYAPGKDLDAIKEEVKQLIFEERAATRAQKAFDILRTYEKELHGKNSIDSETVLAESISHIRNSMAPPILVIDGFYDPTGLEMEIIRELIDKSDLTFVIAEEGTKIVENLKSLGKQFNSRKLVRASCRKGTGYYSYPSMEDEVEGIAKNIRKLILEGVNPWEITVCFPIVQKYLATTRRVFKKHGIPVNIGELSISNTGPFVTLGEMITCIEEDYPRNDFLSFLTSPYFPNIPSGVKERAVSYAYSAGIVKGKKTWLSIEDILLNSLQNTIPDDGKKQLSDFRKDLVTVITIIDNLKNHNDLLSFIDAFESALERLGFFAWSAISPLPAQTETAPEIIRRKLSELRQFAILYGPDHQYAEVPTFYLNYLLQGIKGSEENRDGVKILPIELAAGAETRALFFGGMLEGDFPSRPGIDPILPEKVKKALKMPYIEYYIHRQKEYYNRLLNISDYDPWISCPAADGDKVFLPSPFLDWGKAQAPAELNIFTEEDVQIQDGAVRRTALDRVIFRDDILFPSQKSLSILQERIGTLFKGHISVTSLDFYRKCPLRFYIEKILGLEAELPPKFEVQSRLWGTLAHKTMEYLFKDGEVEPDVLDKKTAGALDKALRQFPIGDFWSRVAKEIFQKLLPRLKEQERELQTEGFFPVMVEENVKAEIQGMKLKGKIDRIDRRTGEEHNGQRASDRGRGSILLDYKTGAIDGDSLQMPLYACMWEECFSEPVEKTGYYSLKEGRIHWYPKKKGMKEFIHHALQEAEAHVRNLKKGVFPAAPVKAAECRYCHHSPLCNDARQ